MIIPTLENLDVKDKRVLVRLDFDYLFEKNFKRGKKQRFGLVVPTLKYLLDGNAKRQTPGVIASVDPDATRDCSLDYARSLALSADNESLLKQIFEILQRDIPDQQLQLENALAKLDQDRLTAIVHKLHGVTCYASLPRLRRKLLGFQQSLADDSNTPLDISVQKLNQELSAVKLEVDRYLEQMDAEGISS